MENEIDNRKKAEAQLTELRRKLDEEQSKRTRELNNNQQVNDKINALEKQVSNRFLFPSYSLATHIVLIFPCFLS